MVAPRLVLVLLGGEMSVALDADSSVDITVESLGGEGGLGRFL